ncbi:hypothetical protein [Candidatus Deianiraea vastatrix]|nr:hypothetical protein [Candidatus Deianiraea vastatrix]
MSSEYNSYPLISEYLVSNANVKKIRSSVKIEEIVGREIFVE